MTDAIGKINLKDPGLLHSKLTKGGSVHAPLATPENMDLGPDYAAVSTLICPPSSQSLMVPFCNHSPNVVFPFLCPFCFLSSHLSLKINPTLLSLVQFSLLFVSVTQLFYFYMLLQFLFYFHVLFMSLSYS